MWVIREADGKFELGYYYKELWQFQVYEVYEYKYMAEKQCHYLNGGN